MNPQSTRRKGLECANYIRNREVRPPHPLKKGVLGME